MDLDIRCNDFLFDNKSSSIEIDVNYSCEKLPKKSQNKPKSVKEDDSVKKCGPLPRYLMTSSSSSPISSGLISQNCSIQEPAMKTPNISYELAEAKSIMQQISSISGDNLFDHLSDIIKRVIDERPPNVIDFFEEFSRKVREQKLHSPENFPPHAVFEEKPLYKVAKKQLASMNLPYSTELMMQGESELEEEYSKNNILKFELKKEAFPEFRTFNDRVQYLQFFWNQCGFSISSDDIFQLACSMNRLQTHPSISQCRFWGMINGLKASYFIVEATLTNDAYESRLFQMQNELEENRIRQNEETSKNQKLPDHIGPELIPGAVGWENYPEAEILKMKPHALPVPLARKVEMFDIPPEPIGKGVNRYSYFVVNSLSDEWFELPIVTPKQISVSRDIKKFFTGDLEEDIVSNPCFNGKEKHYLRAMIARITAGSYVAPNNYYRKMTKKERRLFGGEEDEEEDGNEEEDSEVSEESEEEEGDEQKESDNDIVLLKNEKYDSSILLSTLNNPEMWVHVRPNILSQGRVVWYNQEKEEREREKERKRLQKLHLQEEMVEDESDYSEDEEEGEEEESEVQAEIGPAILTPLSRDKNSETPVPWVGRFTSRFTNQNERILIMQSNIWPGAYTFVFKDLCETIYLGWGHKAVSRNMNWKHLKPIEEEYKHKHIETTDPSAEMEEAYRLSLLKNEFKFKLLNEYDEHVAPETSDDDEDEDDEDEEDDDE